MSGVGGDPNFERSVGRWLRAYPRRWRAARAAEVTAVLADLAEPGATRLDVRSGVGLVRAGWATRWREHPPLLPWLGYRLLDRRLPVRYRPWVRDDIAGALLMVRTQWLLAGYLLFVATRDDGRLGFTLMLVAIVFVLCVLMDGTRRRSAMVKHMALRPGEQPDSMAIVHGWVYRPRFRAVSLMPLVSTLLGVAAVAGTVAAGFAHRRLVVSRCGDDFGCTSIDGGPVGEVRVELIAAVVALVVGVALVPVVRGRLTRVLPGPEQTCRWPVEVTWRHWAGTAVLVLCIGAWAAAEASGHLVLLSTPATLISCLAAPGSVAAWRLLRARPDLRDVAGVDVRRVAVTGRAPKVDTWMPGYVPAVVEASAVVVAGAADAH